MVPKRIFSIAITLLWGLTFKEEFDRRKKDLES
jgi:hypothetical protein